jgi:hypothetical protein
MRASRLEVVIGTLVFRRCSGAISEHRGRFGSRLGLAVLVVAMGCLCSWGSAKAQCIDYGDFLHWVGAVDTPGEAYGVAISSSRGH